MPHDPDKPKATEWVRLTAIIPAQLFPVWQNVVDTLEAEGITHPNEPVRNGIILEIVCAEFLAGPRS